MFHGVTPIRPVVSSFVPRYGQFCITEVLHILVDVAGCADIILVSIEGPIGSFEVPTLFLDTPSTCYAGDVKNDWNMVAFSVVIACSDDDEVFHANRKVYTVWLVGEDIASFQSTTSCNPRLAVEVSNQQASGRFQIHFA